MRVDPSAPPPSGITTIWHHHHLASPLVAIAIYRCRRLSPSPVIGIALRPQTPPERRVVSPSQHAIFVGVKALLFYGVEAQLSGGIGPKIRVEGRSGLKENPA
jgi:hypothetical protein